MTTETLIKRIEQLEQRVAELESKLSASKTKTVKATGRGRGRPSTINDVTVDAVKELLAKGETVRTVLKKLKMSRAKFYAIKAIINCSDNNKTKQNTEKPLAEQILAEALGGQMPTRKSWLDSWNRMEQWLFAPIRKDTITSNEVAGAVRFLFVDNGLLRAQSNKVHDRKLRNLLSTFKHS